MKKFLFLMVSIGFCTGCTVLGPAQQDTYAPPGQPVVAVGTVDVYRTLKYGGRLIEDQLVVKLDDNGHTILLAGEGESDEIAVYLKESARRKLAENLRKIAGLMVLKKGRDPGKQQFSGHITTESIDTVPSSIQMQYSPDNLGTLSVLFLDLSGHDLQVTTASYVSRPGDKRDRKLVLTADAVAELLPLVEQAREPLLQ